MKSRYKISLGGVQMDSLDDNLLILDISCPSPEYKVNQIRSAGLDGYEYGDEYLEKQTVVVTFELHIYDIAKRNEACQKVNAWAKTGGTLSINDRKGQRLIYTRCEKYASIESARNWTDPLTLVFATTYVPYWQSTTAKTLSLSGKSAKGTLKMDGNTGNAVVTVTATAEATVTSFQITAGDSKIKLTGLSIASGKQLVIDHKNGRILRIRADGKSVMGKLDASSSDMLTVPSGQNTSVSISASNKMTITVTARGLWV